VARRHLPEAARGRPHRLGRGNNRRGSQHRRPARDRRAAYRSLGGRNPRFRGGRLFWSGFLKSLTRRGLRGVKLVISDAHEGLKAAIRRVFGAGWQRCRVHWMRNALAYVAKTQQSMVAAALRQAFLQPDRAQASATLRHVADQLRPKWPKLAAFIDDSETDVLSYLDFPEQHRSKLHSTDEIDKPFSAGSLAHVGTGRALERARQPFCPSKARWPRGLLGCGFVNADSRRRRWPQASVYKAASQQRQSAVALGGLPCSKATAAGTAHCPLRDAFGMRCGIVILHGRPRGEEQAGG
jgi:Transposase, Mutator family